jgi:hypothetical protein
VLSVGVAKCVPPGKSKFGACPPISNEPRMDAASRVVDAFRHGVRSRALHGRARSVSSEATPSWRFGFRTQRWFKIAPRPTARTRERRHSDDDRR